MQSSHMSAEEKFYERQSVTFNGPLVPALTSTQAVRERELLQSCPWDSVKQGSFFKRAETIAQDLSSLAKDARKFGKGVSVESFVFLRRHVWKAILRRLQGSIQYWKLSTGAGIPMWVYRDMLAAFSILGDHMRSYIEAQRWEDATYEPTEYSEVFLKLDKLTRGCVAELQGLPTPRIATQISACLTHHAGDPSSKSDYDTLIYFSHRIMLPDYIANPPCENLDKAEEKLSEVTTVTECFVNSQASSMVHELHRWVKPSENRTRIPQSLVHSTIDGWRTILCGINGKLSDMDPDLAPSLEAEGARRRRTASFAFASGAEGDVELVSDSILFRNVAEGFRHDHSWRNVAWKN